MAGVPLDVVSRAEQVSQEFFEAFKEKLSLRRQSKLPLVAQADFAWLMKLAMGQVAGGDGKAVASVGQQMEVLKRVVRGHEGK
jgi:DNA mismatch repair protein MSH6